MKNIKAILKLTKAQKGLLRELREGRIIYEDRSYEAHRGLRIHYWSAGVSENCPHMYSFPRKVNKQTVWVLLSYGLIEKTTLWQETKSPVEVYALVED